MLLLYYWFYRHMPLDQIKVSSLINSLKTFSFLLLAWIILIMNNQSCRYCDKMVRLPNTKKICNMESIWWTTKSGKWLKPKLDHKVHIWWCPSWSLFMEKMTQTFCFSTSPPLCARYHTSHPWYAISTKRYTFRLRSRPKTWLGPFLGIFSPFLAQVFL